MGALLSGLDLCLNPTNPGVQDPEGHYPLGFSLIERATASSTWSVVNGFSMNVTKNTDFVVTLYDLSGVLGQIDFVTIAWRPDESNTSPSPDDSPFSSSDFDDMLQGKVLASPTAASFCGCGAPAGARAFRYGQYSFKNSGPFDVTIEARVTWNGTVYEFKCDPKIIVGS
jgi:hypothetical protein